MAKNSYPTRCCSCGRQIKTAEGRFVGPGLVACNLPACIRAAVQRTLARTNTRPTLRQVRQARAFLAPR
jgi:hypothetical protein